jgi:CheY-like chemotaxis protein
MPHVFELFRQRDGTPSRQHGGLGLGLALVKHLVELHGGSVECASPGEGLGAVFSVKLPLMIVASRVEGVHPTAETGAAMPPAPSLEGVSVLVVDDDTDARHLITTLLEERGARVRAVGSADEALAALESDRPDVLVSDIEMPGQDGYSLMRTIRALPPERGGRVPAAALTAYARTEDRMQALLRVSSPHAEAGAARGAGRGRREPRRPHAVVTGGRLTPRHRPVLIAASPVATPARGTCDPGLSYRHLNLARASCRERRPPPRWLSRPTPAEIRWGAPRRSR